MFMSIKAILWYDVEDYVNPKADDALLKLIEMMDARGIKGTFKMVGEKARVLKERERTDILEKLAAHDIGYHTDTHSQHPTISEYLEEYGFREGAKKFEEREQSGFNDVTDICGKHSSTYGQPGYSWAPNVFPVLRKWGIPTYVDSIDIISVNKKPYWYGGILSINHHYGILRMGLGGSEDLEKAREKFDRVCQEHAGENNIIISIYYHPCEFSCTQFWDGVNFARGRNTPKENWKPSILRSDEEMQEKIDRLGQFLDYITEKGARFITCSELPGLDRCDYSPFSMDEVRKLAQNTVDQVYFHCDGRRSVSASEIFSLFSRKILGQSLEPELFYGPENDVRSEINGSIRVSDVKKALSLEYPLVCGYKQLPDLFSVDGSWINPVDMTCMMAKIIRDGLKDDDEVEPVMGVLRSAAHVSGDVEWGRKWVIHPENLKVPNLVRITKLQAWTLKPAIL